MVMPLTPAHTSSKPRMFHCALLWNSQVPSVDNSNCYIVWVILGNVSLELHCGNVIQNVAIFSHSITDQQQKQAIQFNRGVSLEHLSDRILVASSHDIYALVPVPWETQVRHL